MKMLSEHISMREATISQTATAAGIVNQPDDEALRCMRDVANEVVEPARVALDVPFRINSFFRCQKLNDLISRPGAASQHIKGQAVDLSVMANEKGATNAQLFYYIKDSLEYDQLIWEFGTDQNPQWVHVSYVRGKNRCQVLRARRINDKITYEPFDN